MQFILLFSLLCFSVASFCSPLTVTDFKGNRLVLEKPAKRLISLAPHITENIYSAGAGDLIVGVIEYSDYPIQAKALPTVGSAFGISIEQILALKPDLVIAWDSGNSQKTLDTLATFNIPIYYDDPKTLEDVAKSVNDIGLLTGRYEQSLSVTNAFIEGINHLEQTYASRAPVSVFYQIWNDPLMTLSGQHIVSDVMATCGGQNVFADLKLIAPQINIESVLLRNPDTIITSGEGNQLPAELRQWQQWQNLTAVKNNHLFLMPPDILQRKSLRLLDAANILCQFLDKVRVETLSASQ